MGALVYLPDVTTLALERDRCVGCGTCVRVCPQGVLELVDRRSRIVDRDACMECSACAVNCAAGAIFVQRGVGCALAVINASLGRSSACCTLDSGCPPGSLGPGDTS